MEPAHAGVFGALHYRPWGHGSLQTASTRGRRSFLTEVKYYLNIILRYNLKGRLIMGTHFKP